MSTTDKIEEPDDLNQTKSIQVFQVKTAALADNTR